ncbi:hypothetical protein [Roseibium marinum]|uniref:Tetratricopeptide repeat protein n=1 Tax=Roseibium marinum TaxID=281252 RepID=A0A2S3UJG7_9HYPH|nr:hypothetical protein [Roseibium marinum]POF27837.1 hypothetical protein CLV41_12163 [Roseibium marinum]
MPLPDWLYAILPASIANKHLADQSTHPKYERAMKAIESGDVEQPTRTLEKLMSAKYVGPSLKLKIQTLLPELLAGLGRFEAAKEVALSCPANDAGMTLQDSVVGGLLGQIAVVEGEVAEAADCFEHAAQHASCWETTDLAYVAGYRYATYLLEIGAEAKRVDDAVSKLMHTLERTAEFAYHEPCLRHLQVAAAYQAGRYDKVLQFEPRIRELEKADEKTGGQWSEPIGKAQMMVFNAKLKKCDGDIRLLDDYDEKDEEDGAVG